MKKITVVGAGLSGMVAAVNLAKEGYEVTVLEAAKKIGGTGDYHPSIHVTPVAGDWAWDYCGVDIRQGFIPLKRLLGGVEKKRYRWNEEGLYAVERGTRKTSLDAILYDQALAVGVKFEFGSHVDNPLDLPPGSIIATGLLPHTYNALEIPSAVVYGYMATTPATGQTYSIINFEKYTVDYGYVTISHGLAYALLFSRKPLKTVDLVQYRDMLSHEYELDFENWKYIIASLPIKRPDNLKLFTHKLILAGTISGMMDPFFLFGIQGAILSGKIAATAVSNREAALKEFSRLNKNFMRLLRIRQVYDLFPSKLLIMHLLARYPGVFKTVLNYMGRGIPGMEQNWIYNMLGSPQRLDK